VLPAPHRLVQPSPRTSLPLPPLVVLAGTARRSPWTARKLARSTPCDARLVLEPAQPRPPLCRAFQRRQSRNRDAFRRVAMSRVTPTFGHACSTCLKSSHELRTVLTLEPPRRAPARHTECSSASAASPGSPCGSPRDPDARCFGPTSAISLLRTSTRASPVLDASCRFSDTRISS